MTHEEINVAIAEFFGWKRSTYAKEGRPGIGDYPVWVTPIGNICDDFSDSGSYPFSYYNLNSIHEAEKLLTAEQRTDYTSKIARYLKDTSFDGLYYLITDFDMMHAPASLRAEMLLKTIGKWKE
jgi:hypothetical protein